MKKNQKNTLVALSFVFALLVGCNSFISGTNIQTDIEDYTKITQTKVVLLTASVPPTETKTQIATNTGTATQTATLTPTPTTTHTKTSTATPTLALPVMVNTSIPQPDQEMRVDNARGITELARFGLGEISSIAWSQDSKKIALATHFGVDVRDAKTLDLLCKYDMPVFGWKSTIGFSINDTRIVVTGAQDDTYILSPDTCELLAQFDFGEIATGEDTIIWPLFIAQTGDTMVFGKSGGMYGDTLLWIGNPFTRKVEAIIPKVKGGYLGSYRFAAVSSDYQYGAYGLNSSKELEIWNIQTKTLVWTFNTKEVQDAAFSPIKNEIISISRDGNINLWNLEDGTRKFNIKASENWLMTVRYINDGDLIAVGTEKDGILFINPETGEIVKVYDLPTLAVVSLAESPDNTKLAAYSRDQGLMIWDMETDMLVNSISDYYPRQGIVSVHGNYLAAHLWDYVKVFDMQTGKLIKTLEGQGSHFPAVFSSDGKYMATIGVDNYYISIWSVPDFELIATKKEAGSGMAFHPVDGTLAVSVFAGPIKIYTIPEFNEVARYSNSRGPHSSLAFNDDGSWLVAQILNHISVYKTSAMNLWRKFDNEQKYSDDVIIMPDNETIMVVDGASTQETIPLVITMYDGTVTAPFTIRNNIWVETPFALSRDGTLMAIQVFLTNTEPSKHIIEVWDYVTGQIIKKIPYDSYLYDLLFTEDNRFLIGALQDGTIRVWGIDPR